MNILFMSLLNFDSLKNSNIYTDLLRKFYKEGHCVYAISPVERRKKERTHYCKVDERQGILKLKIGNVQKTNVLEKGLSTLTLEYKITKGIKTFFSDVKFDLVLYSTPPITFLGAVRYVKKRDNAVAYLMLKDIFPQNAVDMGMLKRQGLRGVIYRYFRRKEKKLYQISDYIGCMSQANVNYILENNHELASNKIEICPNCIEVTDKQNACSSEQKEKIKRDYQLPLDKKIFVYGGNIGRPQGIDFIISFVKAVEKLQNVFVLIVGSGTEYEKLELAIQNEKLKNTKLYSYLPKAEYDILLHACDVGLIFLDYRFTIPNFPSRILSYMDVGLPVFAIVDKATDVGEFIVKEEFGWTCGSDDLVGVIDIINKIDYTELDKLGCRAKEALKQHFSVDVVYDLVMAHFLDK